MGNLNQKQYFSKNDQNIGTKPKFEGFLKNGNIDVSLFDYYAEKITDYWFLDCRISLSKSQIRNIYNEVKSIEKIAKNDKDKALIRLKMLKSKIRYNEARDTNKLSDKFGEEIISWINCVTEKEFKKEFDAFCKLFEAVVGFSYKYARK